VSHSVEGEKGADDELDVSVLQPNEERVRCDSGLGTEGEPTAPGSVSGLVRFFLLRVKDDSIVCRARMRKEEISLGRGEMAKSFGISCDKCVWKRWVSTWSVGKSGAKGCG
jgi:hypothetical protein